ncbi:GntR family transcriptional regulator [Alteromonas pelagimontana]|uniref:GntR family transcriptional regulator n=1 Tax=Alteromonas pelagimontana TaxID=1858656 RepID=A0A6M4MDR1_9ALTE|nr:GntR family transcriptional regulator [Alteromonas pelagimontana]QJR81331.1 GntR family transcriptional regulator [Alteromonas pelagimontana]
MAIQISYTQSTSEQVFQHLRDEIVNMSIEPGSGMSENTLAMKFGVSRTPIRETIAKLVALGFAEVRPQRGTFVSKLSISKILEARFIREALEVAIVSYCAEFGNEELVIDCESLIHKQELAANKHDALAFQKLDDNFHQLLADYSQFQRAASLIQYEKAHMDRVRNLSLKEFGGQYDSVLSQHRAIVKAIRNKDINAARQAMTTHLHEILNVLDGVKRMHPDFFEEEAFVI